MNNQELDLFVENIYRLKHKLVKVVLNMILDYDTHVPDLMTRMRALPGFVVIGQADKVDRLRGGGARLTLSIKFLPKTSEIYENLDDMAKLIKNLPGVKNIKIATYNGKQILKSGKPIIY
jgi:hypothetical protein